MILTATPRNDGAVVLTAPTSANYEVYRSADGVNFVKIGNIANGTTYKDLRPHMNWKWYSPTDAISGGTWNVNEYWQFVFTGRKIGIQANKFGDGAQGRNRVIASISEDGIGIETVDLGTMSNTNTDNGGEEYNGMMVWAKDYKSIVTKTIKIQRTYSASPNWGLIVNGFWVETGEQVIEFGQQGYYKFKDTGTGTYSDVVTVTPQFDYASRLNDIFNDILNFQLAQPNQVIDVTPVRSTPYLMWKTLPFAWAYMVTGEQKYKDAADRQFTLAQTLKYGGNICFDLPGVSSYYGMPDYNARHANSAIWCYKIFGDVRYLREAEQVAEAARTTYAFYTYRGFTPVLYNYAVQDWFASIGCMYAQLWADPASVYYHSTTYLNLAKASLGCWLTFLTPTTGEVEMNRDTGVTSHPDGVYSQFAVSNAYVANALLRNTDGTPIMPELEAGLAKTHKWETKYSIEPMTFYNARYHSWGGAGGASRSMSAYEETKAGRYTFEDWHKYYDDHIGPAYYADISPLISGGAQSAYWPSGSEMVNQDWYSKNMINVAFGPVMANAAGIPEEWYTFGGTPTEEQPPTTTTEQIYFSSQLDTNTFDRIISDYFPATYARSYSPVTITVDTIRRISQSITSLYDSKRSITNSNTSTPDTKRKITNTNTVNPDTKRIVRVSQLLQVDTRRLVSALVTTVSDTLRQVMGASTVTATVDTIRRVVVSDSGQNDTKRKITNTNIITGDTKRSVWLNVQNAVDTVRCITNNITNSIDTLRQIVNLHITVLPVDTLRKVVNSQFIRIDTKRSVWKQVQTLADTIRRFFTGGAWPVTLETVVTPRKVDLDVTQRKVVLEVDGKMRNIVVTAGNTVNLKATFYDTVTGLPASPAGLIKFIIFDEGQNEIENFSINDSNKVSDGVYSLDYTTPRSNNRFLYWEASSTLGEVAELDRKKIELKWVV